MKWFDPLAHSRLMKPHLMWIWRYWGCSCLFWMLLSWLWQESQAHHFLAHPGLSFMSSSVFSPPPGRFLSCWLLSSTLPGEHQGWEFIKSLDVAAACVNEVLLEALLNFLATFCSFCTWKTASYLTSSAIFSYPSFPLQCFPTLCSALFFRPLILL